jgi:hypothetical protein
MIDSRRAPRMAPFNNTMVMQPQVATQNERCISTTSACAPGGRALDRA